MGLGDREFISKRIGVVQIGDPNAHSPVERIHKPVQVDPEVIGPDRRIGHLWGMKVGLVEIVVIRHLRSLEIGLIRYNRPTSAHLGC